MNYCLLYGVVGCLLFRGFEVYKETFRTAHYIADMCSRGVSVKRGSTVALCAEFFQLVTRFTQFPRSLEMTLTWYENTQLNSSTVHRFPKGTLQGRPDHFKVILM